MRPNETYGSWENNKPDGLGQRAFLWLAHRVGEDAGFVPRGQTMKLSAHPTGLLFCVSNGFCGTI